MGHSHSKNISPIKGKSCEKETKKKRELMFLQNISEKLARDYVVIVDMSGSMNSRTEKSTRWDEAREALEFLVGPICELDPDGITLYFFSDYCERIDNITSPETVKNLFEKKKPSGSTNLSGVLKKEFDLFFQRKADGKAKFETILVITDGAPNCQETVVKEIIKASKKIDDDDELSISFIQIGNESGARDYLKRLDNDLEKDGAKFDIVDTRTYDEMMGMGVPELIVKSITS